MKITWCRLLRVPLIPLLAITSLGLQAETDSKHEISGRLNIVGSSGKPTNDVLGYGFSWRRQLSDDWFLGINLDHSPSFDFERPYNIVGISSDEEIDAVGTMTMLSVVGERRYPLESKGWIGFWNLGAGFNEIKLDDADGLIAGGGGSYDIETDVDTEFVLLGGVGLIQEFGKSWSARYELTAEHHSGGWDVRDKVSGNTGEIDDYAIYGLRLGLTYRY